MPSSRMERAKEESKLPAPCVLWPVELKLTHIDCSPEDTLVHFQGQYMTICELDYNILQVEIQNAVKSKVFVKVGELCLVEDAMSGHWYRGRVQNIQKDMFHVFLLDHGDVLIVGPSHLSCISDTLLMLPPKIVCGFFANILPVQNRWDSLTESYFSSLIGSQIKGYIHARLPYHVLLLEAPDINCDLLKLRLGRHVDTSTFLLLVEMFIEEPIPQSNESVPDLLIEKQTGQECCLKSTSLLGFEEILSLNGPKLKVGQKARVIVAAAVNPRLFYCRLSSMSKDLQEMSNKLARACESDSGSLSNKPLENLGLLCAVKGKDEKWHRGFVQCLPLNSQVRVVFVDSGYCESVKVENILQLPSEFLSTPIMAFPCSLSCFEEQYETIKNQQLELLKTGLLGKALEVEINDFGKDQNFYLVTLSNAEKHSEEQAEVEREVFDTKPNFPHNVHAEIYATEMKAVQTSDTVPSEAIPGGSLFEGYVVHVQSPKHFWIRTKEQNPNFENMTKEMTDYFNKLQLNEEVFEDPVPGAPSPNPYHVKPECEQQNDAERCTASETTKPKVIPADTFKPIHFKPGSELSVIISHINSPSDFWCQNESSKVDLDKLMEEMQAFYQTHTIAFKSPGVCCAVKSPQDNRWHRACMLEEKYNKLYLMLVDFGIIIQEKMQNIQALAPQFFELHEQAFRCTLNLTEPFGGSSWSVEACNLFKDFVSEGSPRICRIHYHLYEQGKGLLYAVTLHTPLQQATTYLVEKGVAEEVQTPKQLISSAHPRSFVYSSFNISFGSEELVHVTQVCSPWEIYFQLDRNTEIVDTLTERVAEESHLLTATSGDCSGNVCLAKYICDGKWYRALTHPVQSHQHVSVFFVDYGDMQISEKTNVMPIPTTAVDLLMTPMQALRCSLSNVPEGEHLPEVNTWLETDILNKSFRAMFVSRDKNGHFVCDLYDGNVHVNEKVKELMSTQGVEEHDRAISIPALDSHKEEVVVDVSNSKVTPKARGRGKTKQVDKQTPKPTKSPKAECKGPIKAKRQDMPCSLKVVLPHQSLPKLCDLPGVRMEPGSKGVGFISHCNSVRSFFVQMEDDEPNILQMGEELNSTVFKDNMKNVETEVKVGDLVVAEYEEDLALYRAVVSSASNCGHFAVEFIDYGNTATVDRKNVHMLTNTFLSRPRLSTPCTLAKPYSFENNDSFIKEAVGKPLMVEFIRKLENSWEVRIEIVEDCHVDGKSKYDGDQSKDVDLTSQDKFPKAFQSNNQTDSYIHKDEAVNTFQQKAKPNTQQPKCEFENNQTVATKQIKKAVAFLPKRKRTRKRKVNFQLPCATRISVTKNTSMLLKNVSPHNANDLETSKSTVSIALQDVKDNESVKSPDKSLDHPRFQDMSSKSSFDRPQTLFQAPVQMNFGYKGFAAAVTTPSEFYVILEDLLLIVDTVSVILENLPKKLAPLPEVHFVPGASCLVKSVEKKKWCRAEIVQCDFTSVLMNLVDYGQYVVLSRQDFGQLKKLPEELSRLPKVTYHCLLRGVKPKGQDWSDEAIIFFQNCMCHSNLQIRFRQRVFETQWEVDVVTGKRNLAKELVDADHAMYIDNMLGIRFQQELGPNREPKQDFTSSVNVLSMITELTSKAECSQPLFSKESMFDQKSSQESVGEQNAHPLNRSEDLGPVERATLSTSVIKQCELM
uniref:Si:dkeyp-93d12.1 n=2 Tax=Cyprinus carpio TaxID=7962 RepID=A0A8C2IN73_CYPCA